MTSADLLTRVSNKALLFTATFKLAAQAYANKETDANLDILDIRQRELLEYIADLEEGMYTRKPVIKSMATRKKNSTQWSSGIQMIIELISVWFLMLGAVFLNTVITEPNKSIYYVFALLAGIASISIHNVLLHIKESDEESA